MFRNYNVSKYDHNSLSDSDRCLSYDYYGDESLVSSTTPLVADLGCNNSDIGSYDFSLLPVLTLHWSTRISDGFDRVFCCWW